jgi:RNA polymerase sigma-70 factor (ECF subfamily)
MRFLDPQSLAQHTDRLYRAAWALCGSADEAEDLVQETFVRVLQRPRLRRGEASDLTHLMCALHNNFLESRRDAERSAPARAPRKTEPVDPRPKREPQEAWEVRELYAAIAGLPEHDRLTLVAIDVMGLSQHEASRSLGVSQGTVPTRLSRARRLVTHKFAERAKPRDPTPEPGIGTKSAPGGGGG